MGSLIKTLGVSAICQHWSIGWGTDGSLCVFVYMCTFMCDSLFKQSPLLCDHVILPVGQKRCCCTWRINTSTHHMCTHTHTPLQTWREWSFSACWSNTDITFPDRSRGVGHIVVSHVTQTWKQTELLAEKHTMFYFTIWLLFTARSQCVSGSQNFSFFKKKYKPLGNEDLVLCDVICGGSMVWYTSHLNTYILSLNLTLLLFFAFCDTHTHI